METADRGPGPTRLLYYYWVPLPDFNAFYFSTPLVVVGFAFRPLILSLLWLDLPSDAACVVLPVVCFLVWVSKSTGFHSRYPLGECVSGCLIPNGTWLRAFLALISLRSVCTFVFSLVFLLGKPPWNWKTWTRCPESACLGLSLA